jgi:hypothetical protein
MTSALNDYTPGTARIIRDAQAAGLEVSIEGSRTFIVAKREKRWNKVTQGVVVYAGGTAFDVLVRLDCAKGVRKLADIRSMIGL